MEDLSVKDDCPVLVTVKVSVATVALPLNGPAGFSEVAIMLYSPVAWSAVSCTTSTGLFKTPLATPTKDWLLSSFSIDVLHVSAMSTA